MRIKRLLFLAINCLLITYSFAEGNYSVIEVDVENIPDVQLQDSKGNIHPTTKIFEHNTPVLLQFIFTSCAGVCPVLSSMLRSVQDDLPVNVKLVSITIDPEYDRPEVLREYAKKFSAKPHWSFYTGNTEDIIQLQESFDVFETNKIRHKTVTFWRYENQWHRIEGFLGRQNLLKAIRSSML